MCVCFSVGEEEGHIKRYSWCAHIYAAQFDISASYCVQRSAAAGGIFSCFIHELINGAQIALLSILTKRSSSLRLPPQAQLTAGRRAQEAT